MASAIDIHTHIMPPRWDDFAERYAPDGWPHAVLHDACSATIMLGRRHFRDVDDRCFTASRRLEDMDRLEIDRQLLSPIPVMFCLGRTGTHGRIGTHSQCVHR